MINTFKINLKEYRNTLHKKDKISVLPLKVNVLNVPFKTQKLLHWIKK